MRLFILVCVVLMVLVIPSSGEEYNKPTRDLSIDHIRSCVAWMKEHKADTIPKWRMIEHFEFMLNYIDEMEVTLKKSQDEATTYRNACQDWDKINRECRARLKVLESWPRK